jgi:ssDNA-binding Zn-finger/Zn-ribbon topoisomerase 1
MLPTFGADGNVHICFDMRGRKDLILCSHYPDPREILKVWNTEFHKNMVKNIKVKDCPRCTFGPYNEIAEEVFIKDKMTYRFP